MKLANSLFLICTIGITYAQSSEEHGTPPAIENPDGMIDLIVAPEEKLDGQIFLINDWDGGDKDNQNVGEELNRDPKIKQDIVILSDIPGRKPKKVDVEDLVTDAALLAKASKKGKIAIAMGAHSRHLLAWLTNLPKSEYDYENISIVSHSNWNELDGRRGYEKNKKPGDPPLEDTHGVGLRRGLYLSLARISDLGVTILEIPRTDMGPGGWGGKIAGSDGDTRIKALDISDLGLVHYLKTGVVEATTSQRNQFVSDVLKKPATLEELNRDLITRYWESNHGVPGDKKDYLKGGKYYNKNDALSQDKELPNIIVFLADDMGFGDPQCLNPGSPIPTPNMDRLAAEGMTFTDAHTASSVCTPTRYSILTGRYPWRTWLKRGVLWMYDKPLISEDRLTLPKMLQKQGYETACIGKWHLGMDWPTVDGSTVGNYIGEKNVDSIGVSFGNKIDYTRPIKNGPTTRGFDYYFGVSVPNFPPYCFIENDRTVGIPSIEKPGNMFGKPGPMIPGWKLEKILPALGNKANEYIERQAKKKNPFFLYFACTAPHTPILPAKQFVGKAKAGPYGDFVHQVDWTIGQIMLALEKNGIAENTIIIVTSDNGSSTRAGDPFVHGEEYGKRQAVVKMFGHNPSYIYRGYKWSIYEGGHRVPFFVRWPGKVKKGSTSNQTICTTDLMATIASITGFELPENSAEDSYDITALLMGDNRAIREATVHHSSSGQLSIRKGKWKLIENVHQEKSELYDIGSDPGEKHNVSQQYPEVVQNMLDLLNKYRDEG